MGDVKKVWISRDRYDRIMTELKELEAICFDDVVKLRISKLLKTLAELDAQGQSTFEEKLLRALEESKRNDADLNANLYILYQDYKRGKISEEEAEEVFERLVRQKYFNTFIY